MNQQQLELLVANLDCEHDATRLRRGIDGRPGILETVVFPKSAKVRVTIDPAATSADLVRAQLERLGFPVRQRREGVRPPALWRNPKVLTSVASGIILAAGWLVTRAHGPMALSWALLLLSLVVGAYYFGREAVEELVRERQVGIELLMLTAAVVATLMGQPLEGAMLAFLYSISEAMEGYTEQKTRKAIEALWS